MAESMQHKLDRVRRPRVHITYDVETGGAMKKVELPFVVGIGFWFLKPDYIRLLWEDPLGSKFFTYGIFSEAIGIIVIRRMSNIRV